MAENKTPDEFDEEEDFNPIGTIWVLVGFVLLIIAFWGYAYFEMIQGR